MQDSRCKQKSKSGYMLSWLCSCLLAGALISVSPLMARAEGTVGSEMVVSPEIPGIQYLIMSGSVPIRTLPDDSTKACSVMQAGEIVIATGVTKTGWYHITYCGIDGYIKSDLIQPYTGGMEQTPQPKIVQSKEEFVISALGDSITYGENVSSQEKVYASVLGQMIGANKVYNYGLRGSAIAGNHPDRFVDRFRDMAPDTDLILVFGGTNDYGFDTPLGKMGDTTVDTFYGGVNLLMCEMLQRYPKAEIVFLTPIRRLRDTRPNKSGNVLSEYAKAVSELGAFYDVPVIDLFSSVEVNFLPNRSRYMKDGIHPGDVAQKKLAEYVYQKFVIVSAES